MIEASTVDCERLNELTILTTLYHMHHYSSYKASLVPNPKSPCREGTGDIGNDFLAVQACDFMPVLCNQSCVSPTMLCNAIQNNRTVLSLASAKPPAGIVQTVVAAQSDARSHDNHRAAI